MISADFIADLEEFLREYPGMVVKSTSTRDICIEGVFTFSTEYKNLGRIEDSYELRFIVSQQFPELIPKVYETGFKIPHHKNYHVNDDHSLCLGSPLQLKLKIIQKPTLQGFAENCVEPYLYAMSYKREHGGKLPIPELEHGSMGELKDYADIFGLKSNDQAKQALMLLGLKKRIANKYPCPCGCGLRLGKCKFNTMIGPFRNYANRGWYKYILSKL